MRSVLLVLLLVALATPVPTGDALQGSLPEPGTRLLIDDGGLPGIDVGHRPNDPPRPPGGEGGHVVVTPEGGEDAGPTERVAEDLAYMPGRVVVKLKGLASRDDVRAVAATVDADVDPRSTYANFDVLRIDESSDPEAAAVRLRAVPAVEYAHADYRVYADYQPNDPLYAQQWNFPAIDMERAWDVNTGATSNIIVAVLDTGVAFRPATLRYNARAFVDDTGRAYRALGPIDVPFAAAPDLTGPDRFVTPYDFIWDDVTPVDLDGHGTHVAGTIGQLTDNNTGGAGMAFNVRLMPVKVIADEWDGIFGAPTTGTVTVLARGIRYATDNGARVINMSLGFRTALPPASVAVLEDAMRYAVSRGVFIAASSGNAFETGNLVQQPAEICSRVDGAMSVAALARDFTRAYYSSTGNHVEIAAPGGDQRRFGTTGGILQQTYSSTASATFSFPDRKSVV